MGDEALRKTMAAAIRTVLEEGLMRASDPIGYLRTAAEEVRQLVDLVDHSGRPDNSDGAAIRAILADEMEAAARDMIRRLHH